MEKDRGSMQKPVWVTLGMATHFGVGIAAGKAFGFWWGVFYGAFAETWLVYRLAAWILA
jgi:hypothetical protein